MFATGVMWPQLPLSHSPLNAQTTAAATRETALAETSALSRGLAARSEVSASRAVLELMQDLAHVLSKIDKLLAEIPPAEGGAFLSPASTPEEVEARCHMLNRVTAEVARVVYLSKKGEDLAFVRALSPRVKATVDRLQARAEMRGPFNSAVKMGDWTESGGPSVLQLMCLRLPHHRCIWIWCWRLLWPSRCPRRWARASTRTRPLIAGRLPSR